MSDFHPSPSQLNGLAEGVLDRTDRMRVLTHLLSGCQPCRSIAAATWGTTLPENASRAAERPLELDVTQVMARLRDREEILSLERNEARSLVAELRNHPHPRRLTFVSNAKRFQTWGFVELLLEYYLREVFNEPREALGWAELALAAARGLSHERYGASLAADLRARAAASLGNARRACSEHRGAEEAFALAEASLQTGTGDPLERARLWHLKGILRKAQRRFGEAASLYHRAIRLYERVGDNHLRAKVMIEEASLLTETGELEAAMSLRQKAIDMLDADREPRLLFAAEHNMIHDLVAIGRPKEALARLERLRPLYSKLGEAQTTARLKWIEGRISYQLGDLAAAEVAFSEVQRAFITSKIPYDAAVASFDLATVYAEQGRTADMKRLAAEMLPIFQSLGIHREAIAAVLVFQRAAEMEAVTAGLIKELAAYFQRASKEPGLRFRAPG